MMNGTYCGRNASVTELKSQKLRVGLTDFGAGINYISVNTPSGWVQICLGFDDIAEYVASGTYSGTTVGRVANRIGGARFVLGGRKYSLSQNDGGNCLHGGAEGFDKKFFAAQGSGHDSENFSSPSRRKVGMKSLRAEERCWT